MENKNDKILENPYIKRLTDKPFDEDYMNFLDDSIMNVNYFIKIPIEEKEFDCLAKFIETKKGPKKLLSNIDAIKKIIKTYENVYVLNFASDFSLKFTDDILSFYYTNGDYEKYLEYINEKTKNVGFHFFICRGINGIAHTNLLVVEVEEDRKKNFYFLDVNPLINSLVSYNFYQKIVDICTFTLNFNIDHEYNIKEINKIIKERTSNFFINFLEDYKEEVYKKVFEKKEKQFKNLLKETKSEYNKEKYEPIINQATKSYIEEAINNNKEFISKQQKNISEKSFAEFLIEKGHQVCANGFFITMNENSDKNCADRVIELIYILSSAREAKKMLEEATFKIDFKKFKKVVVSKGYETFAKQFCREEKLKSFKNLLSQEMKDLDFDEKDIEDVFTKKYSELFKEEILKSGKSELIQKIMDEENKQYLKNLESKHNNESKEKENSIYESASKPVLLSEDSKQKKVNEDKEITDNNQIGSHQKAELKRREEKNSQLQQGNQLQQGEN